jgi:ERCC4-type nuclease
MKLIIDNRETAFIEKINQLFPVLTHQIMFEVSRLDIGDMVIRSDKQEDVVIFERKTIYDLASSIKDGRYNEQSFRLDASPVHNHNIFYLIEGDIERLYEFKARTTKSVLYSCMTSLSFYKGFSVYNTKCLEETCKFVFNFITKLKKEDFKKKMPFYRNNMIIDESAEKISDVPAIEKDKEDIASQEESNVSYSAEEEVESTNTNENDTSVFIIPNNPQTAKNIDSQYIYQSPKPRYSEIIKKEKKANITLDNIGEIMLCAIPGIGSQCAYSIMNEYNGSILDMLTHLSEDATALDKIKIENSQGQQRKISKSSIDNIKRFMLKNNIAA